MTASILIDPVRLLPLLGPAVGRFDVDALAECASTSSELLGRADAGAPSGTVVVADRQTAGRGRRGRHWVSAPEASLTFSLLWRFGGGIERLAGLSLAVGVAVARALEGLGARGIGLKWPNDILVAHEGNWAKLGGILVELQGDRRGMAAVIGIGLNLTAAAFADGAGQAAASLDQVLAPLPERHVLLARLLEELAAILDAFNHGGFPAVRAEWQRHHAWQGRSVQLLHDGTVDREGACLGADADGALLIETSAGVERCLTGDLSLRLA